MNVAVFLGPTLSREEARRHLDATYLPPVAQGDLYRVAKERPFAIGVVDGYFERLPAVWHKEILWALSQGIHVFGAASMGALRAAELAAFGMKGVGEIYEAFRNGTLEDDDEVAVVHGDASTAYRATSEAMVNVRATLRSAEVAGVTTGKTREKLLTIAKSMFYPDRQYALILARALEEDIPKGEVDLLRAFVAKSRLDQKRIDAVSLLGALRDCLLAAKPPAPATFFFSHTEAWDQVVDWADSQPPIAGGGASADLIVAEVRLGGASGRGLIAAGLSRAAASALARRSRIADRDERVESIDRGLRQAHGVAAEESGFEPWIESRGLTPESYRGFLQREAEFAWLKQRLRHEVEIHIVDELRRSGDYARLSRRTLEKEAVLAAHGLTEPTLADAGVGEQELLAWYFEHRIGEPIPLDMNTFLSEMALTSLFALRQEALREYLFVRLSA